YQDLDQGDSRRRVDGEFGGPRSATAAPGPAQSPGIAPLRRRQVRPGGRADSSPATGPTLRRAWQPAGLLLLHPLGQDRVRGPQRFREHDLALAVLLPLREQQVRVLAAGLELMALVELDETRNADVAGLLERLDHRVGVGGPGLGDR